MLTPAADSTELVLWQGWNLIGAPADTPAADLQFRTPEGDLLDWPAAAGLGWVDPIAWGFQSAGYFIVGFDVDPRYDSDHFAVGRGYWLYTHAEGVTVVWPPAPG